MTVDLGAIGDNYRALAAMAPGAETAAAVKADAYGLGAAPVARALHDAGCRTFFVAHLSEAVALRTVFAPRSATIYVLNGLLPGMAPAIAEVGARPILSSPEEIAQWRAFASEHDAPPAAIQIDTGFTRLGLGMDDVETLRRIPERLGGIKIALVMSHLACADTPSHPMNARQLERFAAARAGFAGIAASLANSGGIALGPHYHFDMVRPGIALYGGRARSDGENRMRPVVGLEVPIIQVRDARQGESVGYGAGHTLSSPRRIAIVSIGYADGLARTYGASDERAGGRLFVAGVPCPIVGRISMDLTAIDVSAVPPDQLRRGAMAEVIGPHQSIDDLADRGGTIAYEVLTRLGLRHPRVYSGA